MRYLWILLGMLIGVLLTLIVLQFIYNHYVEISLQSEEYMIQ